MRLAVLLVLVLCVVTSSGDRRRPERGDRDEQRPQRDGGGDRRHHHHQDDRRRYHYREGDDDDDGDDSDDEDDHDDDHHHHHRFVELADADRNHWRGSHDHDHHGRSDTGERDHRKGQDSRNDGQKHGKKNGKKDGVKKPDGRRGGDGEHHQERREDRHHHSEHQQNRGGDAPYKKNHSKNNKKAHHQSDQRTEERQPVQPDPAESGPEPPAVEPGRSSEVTPSAAEEKPLSPAAESLAAALAAEEGDMALSAAGEQAQQDPEAEPLPPPHQDVAAMARYIVHVSDWASMATVSTREPTRGMPFANVFSMCDGTRYRSTGIPYLYLTDMDISVQDLRVNNSASLTMSLAQTSFCKKRGYDPEDPLCAHVILTGRVLQVDDKDPEYVFARDALFARHPEMGDWPVGHHFFVAKLDIQNIIVLDFFGGAKTVPVSEYFSTNPFNVHPRRANML